jgi:hypothetical protein
MSALRRLSDGVFAVAFFLLGSQIPTFVEIYVHRVRQQAIEWRRVLARLLASPTPDPTTIGQYRADIPRLEAHLEALDAGGLRKLQALTFDLDREIAMDIVARFEPGVKLTTDGLIYGASAMLVGLFVSAFVAWIAGLPFGDRRSSRA